VTFATLALERHLEGSRWIAGDTYSLGDINGFNLGYALPLSQPDHCNDVKTPYIMEWLRRIYERPAARETWAKGRTQMAARIKILERKPGA
jgi:GSH-dependent disulfide-bond oxidoreductase